jgi:hypothetical protein
MAIKMAPTYCAQNLSKFLEIVDTITRAWEGTTNQYIDPWFRGQDNCFHRLIPSLYRYDEDIDEDDFRDEFTLRAFPYLQQMRAQDPWESYALMQHYGLPTRLLDWSEAALVALYFAVSAHTANCNAAVWMLDPWALNKTTVRIPWILDHSDEKVARYLPELFISDRRLPRKPVAIQVPYNSPRISAQRGLFTIHGKDRDSIEDVMAKRPERCVRIEIPRGRIIAVRRQLYTAGVGESSLFPELGALCRDLKRHWVLDREDIARHTVAPKIKAKYDSPLRT